MVPDKIYISPNIENRSWLIGKADTMSIEYIRKDTLIEWVKSQKARLKQGYKHDYKNDDTLHGGTLILDSLIDKLESQ